MSKFYCQCYPGPSEGLISTDKTVIARAYPVITILKLRLNNNFNPGLYRSVCRHSMFLLQNSGLLLNLLPWETTFVDDVVKVVWTSKTLPQPEQLNKSMSIRKHCIIGVLYWLIANNLLYKNIKINHCLLKTWKGDFIYSGIMDRMVSYNSDQHKRKKYATDLCDNKFENNLNTAIANIDIKRDHINSGCVYSNIDDR